MADTEHKKKTNREELMEVLKGQAQKELAERLKLKTESTVRRHVTDRQQLRQKQNQESVDSWNRVFKNAQAMIERGHQGFDSWVSAMMQINGLSYELALALSTSNPIVLTMRDRSDEFLRSEFYQGLVYQGYSFFSQTPEVHIPRYTIGVEFNDDGAMDLSVLRSDGKEATEEERHLLRVGVTAWFKENGYNPIEDKPFTYADSDGNRLTKALFEELRDHPEKGFVPFMRGDRFFGKDFEVEATSEPAAPIPTPFPR